MNEEKKQYIDTLVNENINLVHHVLQCKFKFNSRQDEYDDYFQEGCIGLIKAANTFDESKGYVFSTYACMCISNSILMYMRVKSRINKIEKVSLEHEIFENHALEEILTNDESPLYTDISDENSKKRILEEYKKMSFKNKDIFDDSLNGMSQSLLANKYKKSQCQISRLLISTKKMLKKYFKEEI